MQRARRNWSRSWYDDQRSCATRRRFKSNKNWDCEIFPAETTYGIKGLHAKACRINTLMIIKWTIPYKCCRTESMHNEVKGLRQESSLVWMMFWSVWVVVGGGIYREGTWIPTMFWWIYHAFSPYSYVDLQLCLTQICNKVLTFYPKYVCKAIQYCIVLT